MRNFSWFVFEETGDIDAYLLYKASEQSDEREESVSTDLTHQAETT